MTEKTIMYFREEVSENIYFQKVSGVVSRSVQIDGEVLLFVCGFALVLTPRAEKIEVGSTAPSSPSHPPLPTEPLAPVVAGCRAMTS